MAESTVVPVRVQNVMDMEILQMNVWSIKFNSSSVMVVGFVRTPDGNSMNLVTSEAICKRMNSTLLFDVSGRFYELLGQIDKTSQLKQGMSARVLDEFLNGFPENWVFLVGQCLTSEQRSAIRPIQAVPRQPLRQKSPIVTLADETDLGDRHKRVEVENEARKREEIKMIERENAERRRAEERRKREEQEKEDANCTLRAPASFANGDLTPIRFTRGNGPCNRKNKVFEDTPSRETTSRPLAASTPQQKPKPVDPPREVPRDVPARPKTTFATDDDLFAVPKLPANRAAKLSSDLDFLDDMDALFAGARINRTPSHAPKPVSHIRRSPPRRRSPSESRSRHEYSQRSSRYEDDYDARSNRDGTFQSGESRLSRKRGYYRSPDEHYETRRDRSRDRSRDRIRERSRQRYDSERYDSRYDSRVSRPRETSSSSGRSVRFEDDYGQRKNRRYEHKEHDRNRLKDIERREREVEERLKRSKKGAPARRATYSSSEDNDDASFNEWDAENKEILDQSLLASTAGTSRRRSAPKREPKSKKPKPAPAPKHKPRKRRDPVETDDLNDSIASNRPRRACATPATPAPKKITWPRRDMDRLKRVIEMKKPSASDSDWAEVARLLAKDGVTPADVKQIAETKLKWKEPTQDPVEIEEQEEVERKRRRGIAAKVKESIEMREEMQRREVVEDELNGRVEEVEDYQPADVSADESLLAMGTPQVTKKRGGTRKSTLPEPIEDSPMAKGNNSSFMNSPRLDATKAKEQETTIRYVQHLSTMQNRPGSSMNKSQLNKSSVSTRGKNTSMSVEQGTRKAQKMIRRAMAIEEEDEDDDEDDEDDEDEDENREEETSFY